jgi:hypothetical protein
MDRRALKIDRSEGSGDHKDDATRNQFVGVKGPVDPLSVVRLLVRQRRRGSRRPRLHGEAPLLSTTGRIRPGWRLWRQLGRSDSEERCLYTSR